MEFIELPDGSRHPYCKDAPLTKEEIKELIKDSDVAPWASVVVLVNFGDCIDGGWEWFWDELSLLVTGSEVGFQDLEYELVGLYGNNLQVKVSGMFDLKELEIEED